MYRGKLVKPARVKQEPWIGGGRVRGAVFSFQGLRAFSLLLCSAILSGPLLFNGVDARAQDGGEVDVESAASLGSAAADTAAAEAAAEDKKWNPDSIVLNFEAADIREVIYTFASALELNYWLDPRVSGQVTIRTTGPVSREDLFPIFHQLLRNHGFVALERQGTYLIVPAEEAKTKLIVPEGRFAAKRAEDHFVMDIVHVVHVSAEQMAQTLSPFVSPGGDVIAYPRSNLLVITDLASNAARLEDLVATFDTDTFVDMNARVFKIEHAVLEDLASELQALLEAYRVSESGAGAFIIPLARLNAVAVIAFDPQVIVQVDYWLSVLDVPAEAGSRRQVYVYQVENSKAVDLANVLNQIYSDSGSSSSTGRRARSGAAAESGLGLGGGLGGNNRRGQQQGGRQRGQQEQRSRGASGVLLGGDGSGGSELFEREVRIVEDEVTNALVILATPRDYQTIRQVLRELDIVPRQVLIEVMVAEISLNEDESLSMSHELLSSSSSSNSDSGTAADQGGSYFDVFGEEVRLTGSIGAGLIANVTKFRNGVAVYQSLLNAVSNNKKSKVLSRPHIMTADNQEARILVGDEVPIITSQSDTNVQTGGQSRFLQNVQYRDTGIIISVVPQVNSEGLVNMSLNLEVSEINKGTTAELANLAAQSPTFQTRKAETTVVVHSGETLVIGGIIRETHDQSSSGVPYLMDIPVLGQLFRSRSSGDRRTELIVLITPFVVRDREEAKSVTQVFKRRVDSVLREVDAWGTAPESHHTAILEGVPD